EQGGWTLLSNAIKFTPVGGRVVVARRRKDGDLEVRVRDTGEGIDPTVLPYVCDRFRQADSGTTRTHMGLGLGLAIVRHIVELHGGQVGVASDGKGKGAEFWLRLPVVPSGSEKREHRQRIDARAAGADGPVEVRSGDAARGADRADDAARLDRLAFPDVDRGQMREQRKHAKPVIDDDRGP